MPGIRDGAARRGILDYVSPNGELGTEMRQVADRMQEITGTGNTDYLPRSLRLVDQYVASRRLGKEDAVIVASYVGETLRRAVSGTWTYQYEPPYKSRTDETTSLALSRLFRRRSRPRRPVIQYVPPGGIKYRAGTSVKKPLYFDPAQLVKVVSDGRGTFEDAYEELVSFLNASPRERAKGATYMREGRRWLHDGHRWQRVYQFPEGH